MKESADERLSNKVVRLLEEHPEGATPKVLAEWLFLDLKGNPREFKKAYQRVKVTLVRLAERKRVIRNYRGLSGYYGVFHSWDAYGGYGVVPGIQNVTLQYQIPEGQDFSIISEAKTMQLDEKLGRRIEITAGKTRKLTIRIVSDTPIPLREFQTVAVQAIQLAGKEAGLDSIPLESVYVLAFEVSYDFDTRKFTTLRLEGVDSITVTDFFNNLTSMLKFYKKTENTTRVELVYKVKTNEVKFPSLLEILSCGYGHAVLRYRMDSLEKAILDNVMPSQRQLIQFLQAVLDKLNRIWDAIFNLKQEVRRV